MTDAVMLASLLCQVAKFCLSKVAHLVLVEGHCRKITESNFDFEVDIDSEIETDIDGDIYAQDMVYHDLQRLPSLSVVQYEKKVQPKARRE